MLKSPKMLTLCLIGLAFCAALMAAVRATPVATAGDIQAGEDVVQAATPGPDGAMATRIAEAVQATVQARAVEATVQAITGQGAAPAQAGAVIRQENGIPAPVLIRPRDGAALDSARIRFEWRWDGELGENMGFEVRGWLEGESHNGLHDARRTDGMRPNWRGIYAYEMEFPAQFRGKDWYWTVAVVELEPYERIGPEADPHLVGVPKARGGSRQPASPLGQPESPLGGR